MTKAEMRASGVADNVWLILASRLSGLLVATVGIPMGAWIISQTLDRIEANTVSIAEHAILFAVTAEKRSAIDRRITGVEADLKTMTSDRYTVKDAARDAATYNLRFGRNEAEIQNLRDITRRQQ